jgi:hypothetical protein
MIISRRMLFASIPLSILFAGSLQAKTQHHRHGHEHLRSSWDGTWSGAWGGSQPTTITIAGNRVVSYTYQGASTPVTSSRVTATRVSYAGNGTTVTLVRTGNATASATLHSQQGEGTAQLTRH